MEVPACNNMFRCCLFVCFRCLRASKKRTTRSKKESKRKQDSTTTNGDTVEEERGEVGRQEGRQRGLAQGRQVGAHAAGAACGQAAAPRPLRPPRLAGGGGVPDGGAGVPDVGAAEPVRGGGVQGQAADPARADAGGAQGPRPRHPAEECDSRSRWGAPHGVEGGRQEEEGEQVEEVLLGDAARKRRVCGRCAAVL